jgi:hypothetical protein
MFFETDWELSSAYFYMKDDFRGHAESIMQEVEVWCIERFGPEGPLWGICSDLEIRFADPDHAMEFKIRWG